MKIIAATKNKGKIREMLKILSPLGVEIVTQSEAGIDTDVEETGKTFLENALIKARAVHSASGLPVIADDSGLCVEALDGAPGVMSARYAGEGASDEDKINKLLINLAGKENRRAKFVTSVVYVSASGKEITASGEVTGVIENEPRGSNGFGYDPVFFSEELGKTFAESSDEEKNSVSHRSRALHSLYAKLKEEQIL